MGGDDQSAGVKVVARFRPLNSKEKVDGSKPAFTLLNNTVRDNAKGCMYSRYDTVLDGNASQKECYEASAAGLVDDVLNGFNCGLFAYGQSGGGKSFSLLGKEGALKDPEAGGIIPRTIEAFFNKAGAQRMHTRAARSWLTGEAVVAGECHVEQASAGGHGEGERGGARRVM